MTSLPTAAAFAAALLVSSAAFAQGASTEAQAGEPQATPKAVVEESPLVKAAKDGAAKRTTKSRLSIDDKAVKKSKGKLSETSSNPIPPESQSSGYAADRTPSAEDAAKAAASQRGAAAEKLAAAQKDVERLESELRRIEETFYDEDDPDYREEVIKKRFDDTRARLETARQELEAARSATAAGGSATP